MNNFFTKIFTWIKANLLLAIGILIAVVVLFFPKLLRGLTGRRRIRHRRGYYSRAGRRVSARTYFRRPRRTLPRSVGIRRSRTRRQYTKGGKVKKPWQIKGSIAARRHMARIRRMR
jgi:hypothetical protein